MAIYNGMLEIQMTDEEMAKFYQDKNKGNEFGLLENQYLIVKNMDGDIVDKYKWTGEKLADIKYKTIESEMLGRVKPRNDKQECYFDLLDDPKTKLKVCIGGKGVGKSYLAACWALSQVERGKFDKIIVAKNTYELDGVKPLGFTPGSLELKLLNHLLFLRDIVSKDGYDSLLQSEQIEVCHLGYLRGRSLKNAIVWVSECQNLTKELIKTIISRAAENTIIIFDGDTEQCDNRLFVKDSGLIAMAECLSGNKLYGMVKMDKCERSDLASLAELIK